jgi:hypothetical protein
MMGSSDTSLLQAASRTGGMGFKQTFFARGRPLVHFLVAFFFSLDCLARERLCLTEGLVLDADCVPSSAGKQFVLTNTHSRIQIHMSGMGNLSIFIYDSLVQAVMIVSAVRKTY